MFKSNLSKAEQDYITYLDGGSKVPYYLKNCKYFVRPVNIIEELEFDNKLYIKTHNGCYVGIRLSQFVRKISVKEFVYVQDAAHQQGSDKLINKVQLVMEFC